ncbi:MAG: hypothetical protein RKP46_03080 [Candidatus Accumulibacter sp.]|uniref:AAA family ATPase n=1 Tax=Accumulibacter sp. TaxID=2053492 RepID=UPI00287ABB57|nr:AAA family ATPase [Accumulibacter sp.]MDS4013323.1 hypothetical protein [Accumulibacter sp.]
MSDPPDDRRALADLRAFDHRAALWWLALLYRRPKRFQEALGGLASHRQRLLVGVCVFLHALPYVVVLAIGGRLLLHALGAIDLGRSGFAALAYHAVQGIAVGIALGIAEGIAFGIALLRPYYHLYAWLFVWPRVNGRAYPWHPVAWDDLCSLPFARLDRLLVAYAEHDRTAALAEIERLISDYPSQRPSALRARTRLVVRAAAGAPSLASLDALAAPLPEGERGFLAETARVKQWIGEISAVQRQLDSADRPLFRAPLAELLVERIAHFGHRIAGLHEPLASELQPAAANWLAIAQRQRDEVERCRAREPTPQVFRAGDPVDRDQEAFVSRLPVIGELERQVMLSTGCPGIVLYGRRRTGKSTVLVNLPGFLPATVRTVHISLQQPRAFASLASLLELLVARCREVLASSAPPAPARYDLSTAFAFFADIDRRLAAEQGRLLIALDEYEMLDQKIGEGVLPSALLDTLRESIQSHRRITWLFAGSHEIAELPNAAWTSYLVSARTLEVALFTSEETTMLLSDPLRHSRYYQQPGRQRPRFAADFWGADGIDRIHREAGGWPHLVQLLAETAVDLANDRGQRTADAALLEESFAQAVVRGTTVLQELLWRECQQPGEWQYLRGFVRSERQPPPTDAHVYASLRRRLLVLDDDGACRLRVPLMRRWLVQRAWTIPD